MELKNLGESGGLALIKLACRAAGGDSASRQLASCGFVRQGQVTRGMQIHSAAQLAARVGVSGPKRIVSQIGLFIDQIRVAELMKAALDTWGATPNGKIRQFRL